MMKLSAAMDSWERVVISSGTKQIGVTYMDVECRLEFIALLNAATEMREVCQRARQLIIDMQGWTHGEIMSQFIRFDRNLAAALAKAEGPTT